MALSRGDCPWCGEPLPVRIPLARQVPRGFLEGTGMVCPHCDRETHRAISGAALIWWPVAAVLAGVSVYCIRAMREAADSEPGLAPVVIGVAAIWMAAFALSAGYRWVKSTAPADPWYLVVLCWLAWVAYAIALVTGSWIAWFCLIATLGPALLISAIAYWLRLAHHGSPDPDEPGRTV
jgi:hypothetical protein